MQTISYLRDVSIKLTRIFVEFFSPSSNRLRSIFVFLTQNSTNLTYYYPGMYITTEC